MGLSFENSHGFTMLEMLAVVVIIGLLAGISVPLFLHRVEKAKVDKAQVELKQLRLALELFHFDNGFYPSTEQGLNALATPPITGQQPLHYRRGGYVKGPEALVDPWSNPYHYRVEEPPRIGLSLFSLGADGKPGGQGLDADLVE